MFRQTDVDDLGVAVGRVIRVIDWKWLLGGLIALGAYGVNSYNNYNNLIRTVADQTIIMTRLTTRIEALTDQLSDNKTANMKQDFDILRLKDRIEAVEAKQAAVAAVAGRK